MFNSIKYRFLQVFLLAGILFIEGIFVFVKTLLFLIFIIPALFNHRLLTTLYNLVHKSLSGLYFDSYSDDSDSETQK